jgi:hypothetical protein
MTANNKATDKVYIKKDTRIHHLMIDAANSNYAVGIQITPEIAVKIITELAKYLLENK